jgi:GNAT superfamily N-acetyltransferase
LRNGSLAGYKHGRGGLYLYAGPTGTEQAEAGTSGPQRIQAAVLFTSGGTAFPVLSDTADDARVLEGLRRSRAVRACKPSACLGAADHVAALVSAMRWKTALDIPYDAMCLARTASSEGQAHGNTPGVVYRRARAGDLDALYPLAAEYERTEVLTHLHVFDPVACRASQARSIGKLTVYLAEAGGRFVARAQTNALGFSTEQVGGVFVDPAYRGRGIGRGIMAALVDDIFSRVKSVSLFVKKGNTAARSLYLSMGFEISRDYRVSYFL